MYNLSPL